LWLSAEGGLRQKTELETKKYTTVTYLAVLLASVDVRGVFSERMPGQMSEAYSCGGVVNRKCKIFLLRQL